MILYTYFAKEKATGKWGFFRNIKSLINYFDRLASKESTIGNRFRTLEKKEEPSFINEWGFQIYRTKNVKK